MENIPEPLSRVKVVGDAREFEEWDGMDIALSGFSARFVSVSPAYLRGSVIQRIKTAIGMCAKNAESDLATGLKGHIYTRCQHALRTPEDMHHMFRYVPMTYQEEETHSTWFFDVSKEVIATVCGKGFIPVRKSVTASFDSAPLQFAPIKVCPSESFVPRRKV